MNIPKLKLTSKLAASAIVLVLLLSFSAVTWAAEATLIPTDDNEKPEYQGLAKSFRTGEFELWQLGDYVQYLIEVLIYFAGGISVLFIVIGGYKYMIGSVSDDKEAGKKTIMYALGGFVIAVLAWTIVNFVQVWLTSGSGPSDADNASSSSASVTQKGEAVSVPLAYVSGTTKTSEEIVYESAQKKKSEPGNGSGVQVGKITIPPGTEILLAGLGGLVGGGNSGGGSQGSGSGPPGNISITPYAWSTGSGVAGLMTASVLGSQPDDTSGLAVSPVEDTAFDCQPEGTTFNPPIEVVLNYDEEWLNKNGIAEDSLSVDYLDEGATNSWIAFDDFTIDADANTATVKISHFSDLAITYPQYRCEAVSGSEVTQGIFDLEVYGGKLYAGLYHLGAPASKSLLYRLDGDNWEQVNPGIRAVGESVLKLLEWNGYLYANTENSGDIFRSTDGTNWQKVYDGTGADVGTGLAVLGNNLYAINFSLGGGKCSKAKILRTGDGTSWNKVWEKNDIWVYRMTSFDNKIYIFGHECRNGQPRSYGKAFAVTSSDGSNWGITYTSNEYQVGYEWNNALWLGTIDYGNSTPGIYRLDKGKDITQAVQVKEIDDTSDDTGISSIAAWNGVLFAGMVAGFRDDTEDSYLMASFDNGNNWQTVCNFAKDTGVLSLAVYNNSLYAGTAFGNNNGNGDRGRLYKVIDSTSACGSANDPCSSDGDCCSGLTCDNNVCAAPQSCSVVNSACSDSTDCCSGLTCANNTCSTPPSESINCEAIGTTGDPGFFSLKKWNNKLYAGTYGSGKIYSYPSWQLRADLNAGESAYKMLEYKGYLYVNTENNGRLFRTSDGTNFEQVHNSGTLGFGLEEYNNYLYSTHTKINEEAKLYRSDIGTGWQEISWPEKAKKDVRELIEYKGILYGLGFNYDNEYGGFYKSSDGTSWTWHNVQKNVRFIKGHVWNNFLWISGSPYKNGDRKPPASVYRWDGTNLVKVFENNNHNIGTDIIDYNGYLYFVDMVNWRATSGKASLYRSPTGESGTWQEICSFDEAEAMDMEVFDGSLYVATRQEGGHGKVYEVDTGSAPTCSNENEICSDDSDCCSGSGLTCDNDVCSALSNCECSGVAWDGTNCRRCDGCNWGSNCLDYGRPNDPGYTPAAWQECKDRCEAPPSCECSGDEWDST
ncbi:MAG: hypothetical protein ABIH35_04350, partial [Patescibacteria group bacterium]